MSLVSCKWACGPVIAERGCRIRQLVNSSVVLKSSGENMLNRIKNSCNVWLLYPSRILCITLLPFNMSFFFFFIIMLFALILLNKILLVNSLCRSLHVYSIFPSSQDCFLCWLKVHVCWCTLQHPSSLLLPSSIFLTLLRFIPMVSLLAVFFFISGFNMY